MSTTISGMTDIAQSVPTMLGYVPTSHVVIMGTSGQELKVTAAYECRDADSSNEGAVQVLDTAARHKVTGLVVLAYGLDVVTTARALREVRTHAATHGMIVRETARIAHGRIWVGRERGAGQELPDAPGVGAAEQLLTYGSPAVTREALTASWEPTGTLTPDTNVTPQEGAQLWARLLSGDTLSESEQRKTLGMLTTIPGRDGVVTAFGLFNSPAEWPADLADTAAVVEGAIKGVHLSTPLGNLRRLVNGCAPNDAAEVLTVAAVLAWVGGNNAVAGVCSLRADQADPGHRLARFVNAAVVHGLPAPNLR